MTFRELLERKYSQRDLEKEFKSSKNGLMIYVKGQMYTVTDIEDIQEDMVIAYDEAVNDFEFKYSDIEKVEKV